ncbi:hypothetical protein ACTPEW_16135 [Clostridioides difficile]
MKINIKFKLLSGLMHYGDDITGITRFTRTQKFNYNGDYIDVPVYSANAFRGILRRLIMKDYLKNIDKLDEGITVKLYHALFSGGSLTPGNEYYEMEEIKIARYMCPPLSLLGSIIGDQMFEGKLKIGILKPICKELIDYTGIESDKSFHDMLDNTFHTRMDSLKFSPYVKTIGSKPKNSVQMKYEMQPLCSGTELISTIYLESANELEKSCFSAFLEVFEEFPFLGGKSAIGYGEVKLEYNKENMTSSEVYYNHLRENKEKISDWIASIESKLN